MAFEHDIFISYGHGDSSLVERIIEALRMRFAVRAGRDLNLWMDRMNIAPGSIGEEKRSTPSNHQGFYWHSLLRHI
jgi:hypothetical protein